MNNKLFIAAAAGLTAMAPALAQAETVLRIDSWISPKHQQNATVLPAWANAVKKATNGRVTAKISYPPRTHPKTMFDRARTGVADVTWSFHGYTPGRFLLTQIVELPGLDATAYEATVAYQRIHEKYLAKANEHKGVKTLMVFSHGPGVISSKKRITSINDFKGMKVRTPGGVGGLVSKALGVISVPAPATKVYEILAQGVADGVIMPMETKKSLKLKEVAPYSLIYPGGLYMGSFFMVMNQGTFRKLSKADRAAIDSVSGEAIAQISGRAWAAADIDSEKDARASGNTIETASGALKAAIQAKISRIEGEWIKKASAKGIDAKKALAELRAEVKKLKR